MNNMSNYSSDENIKKYLGELADEYKNLLYKKFIENSKGHDELSVSELLRLDNEIKRPLTERKNNRRKAIYKIALIGLLYSFIGLLMFTYYYTKGNIKISHVEITSLIVIFTGLSILLLSFLLLKISPNLSSKIRINDKSNDNSQIEYQIVTMWRNIEGITNELASANTSTRGDTPIDELKFNELIHGDEIDSLKELLSLRNKIINGGNGSIDFSNSFDVVEKCNGILNKLKKIL
jgi:ribosomal protein S17E